jgi:hypothetical protein
MLSTPVGVNRFAGRFAGMVQGRSADQTAPERPKAQPFRAALHFPAPCRSGLGGEKSFAHCVLEATDMNPRKLSGTGLISVDDRTEQVHVFMHMAG